MKEVVNSQHLPEKPVVVEEYWWISACHLACQLQKWESNDNLLISNMSCPSLSSWCIWKEHEMLGCSPGSWLVLKWDPKKIIVYSGLIHVRQFDLVPFIVIGGTRGYGGHGCSGCNDSQMTWIGWLARDGWHQQEEEEMCEGMRSVDL